MFEWLAEQFGEQNALIIYYLVIFVALIIAVLILRGVWNRISGGTFIHGGKDKRRLAVVDATAVDNRRRLVLVRRDNVEHLVMIGGMSDVLIESNIGQDAASAQPSRVELSEEVRPPKTSKTAPIAAAPIVAASTPPAAAEMPVTQERVAPPAPQAEPIVASVAKAGDAPVIKPELEHGTSGITQSARPVPPAPLTREPRNIDPPFDIAGADVPGKHEFDLDISESDLTANIEKPERLTNTFEPTVDFPSDHRTDANNGASHKPLEDEMEALLNQLTGDNKKA